MIEDKLEYIICSAIHYDDGKKHIFQSVYGINTGFVIGGFRHPFILGVIPGNIHHPKCKELGIQDTTQGFITSRGRFVDREEALRIAVKCGQVEKGFRTSLFSEDVFPEQIFRAE